MQTILSSLNNEQQEAVTAPLGPVRVLAGAGSGKTRVLVSRIAWLIQTEQAFPNEILAVTFTNKAANEMRVRLETVLKRPLRNLWLGTFHSLCHRFLRLHSKEANLDPNFQIMDSDDQLRLCKRILREKSIDEKQLSARVLQHFINNKKDEGYRAEHIDPSLSDQSERLMIELYRQYQSICNNSSLVDFSEILLRALETLRNNPALLKHYQSRFKFILVDEFQDTNAIQYAWLKFLAGDHHQIFVVGDDDQSIYGWRGARVENILNFDQDFPNATTIRLEQNYRSTSTILEAANYIIAKNQTRLDKRLWTENPKADLITVYTAMDAYDEAQFVVEKILRALKEDSKRNEHAVLYRSNAQSRIVEEVLLKHNIPYRIYGGLRFFDRAEIKDILAYLRVINNLSDDISLERVLTTPPKGIGASTIEKIRITATERQVPLWDAIQYLLERQELNKRSQNSLITFQQYILSRRNLINTLSLSDFLKELIQSSGLIPLYKKEAMGRGEDRIENLDELITAVQQFTLDLDEAQDNSILTTQGYLSEFLNRITLDNPPNEDNSDHNKVQLMTLHASKGLEFKSVYLIGFDEGLFPSEASIIDFQRLEEERRLAYVGITRAREHLTITTSEQRMIHGKTLYHRPSRFIKDIPSHLIESIGNNISISKPLSASTSSILKTEIMDGFNLGDFVTHPTFGEGTIINFEGVGQHARVTVKFSKNGTKTLVLAYAKLEKT